MTLIRSGLVLAAMLGFAAQATAADMPVKARPIAAPVWSWTGFYAGLHGGWAFTSDDPASSVITNNGVALPIRAAGHPGLGNDGPTFGVHLGYNWQINPTWVIGIEGDISGGGLRDASAVPSGAPFAAAPAPGSISVVQRDVNWLASVRGRLGFLWDSTSMIYVTGGAAWAGVDTRATAADTSACGGIGVGCSFAVTQDGTHSGWTIGGGYEKMLSANWVLRTEYLYYRFSTASVASTAITNPAVCGGGGICTATFGLPDLDIHTIRGGLSYKFGADAAGARAQAAGPAGWTGFYIGGHAGWGWASDTTVSTVITGTAIVPAGNVASSALEADGAMRGTHGGYNWQINPSWVVGIEGDFTMSGVRANGVAASVSPALGNFPAPGNQQFVQRDVNWLATVRGRLAYTWGDAMIYATGGVAFADVDFNSLSSTTPLCNVPGGIGCAFQAKVNETQTGWTIGGGYEKAILANWTVRLEYLYYRFEGITNTSSIAPAGGCGVGTCTATVVFPDFDIHSMRAGVSYKF